MSHPAAPLAGFLAALAPASPAADLGAATAAAVHLARAATGRHRLLLSGSVAPSLASAVAASCAPGTVAIEALAPDPLAIEDLFGRLDDDLAALVVQSPDPFGACRPLETLAALCREFEVPLIVVVADPLLLGRDGPPPGDLVVIEGVPARLWRHPGFRPAAAEDVVADAALPEPARLLADAERAAADTERLVSRLRQVRGVRVVTRAPFAAVAVHLGDERRAEDFAPDLAGIAALPLARIYPGWPELDPVLRLSLTAPLDDATLDRLAGALALSS